MTETQKLCLNCGEPNGRSGDTCSPRCYAAHKVKTVPKQCAICSAEYFGRGKTCSKEHANELKRRTNIEKFGSEWAIQSDAAKDKRRATSIERYGAEHHLQTDESMAKLKATNLERYGVEFAGQSEDAKAKMRKTNLERYGVENPFQSEEIKAAMRAQSLELYGVEFAGQREDVLEQIKQTNLERYGVENTFQSEELMAKVKARNLELYGVESNAQREDVQAKIRATNLERYGVETPFQNEEIKAKARATNLSKLGVEYPSQDASVRAKGRVTFFEGILSGRNVRAQRVSKLNRAFADTLRERFETEVLLESAQGDYSFDLFLPERKLFVELNPTFTHNADRALSCVMGRCPADCGHPGIPTGQHQKRALYARDNGLKLVQIYDWDLDPITKLLDGKLRSGFERFSARKLRLEPIEQKVANSFLKDTHSQGALRGQTHCYGLYEGDRLIAVATFGASRFGSTAQYEFLRYAVARGTVVHGGAGKLFERFVADAEPSSVVSYVDFDHSTGPSFLSGLGFIEKSPTSPTLIWSKRDQRVSTTSLLMQGADRLLGTSYGSREESGMNNEDIMRAEGWLRVHNSGNRVFLWEN